jgi:UDP-glucose 4-epimerase
MRIIVTGAAGLIGSRIAGWITEHFPDASVIAVDDLSGGFIENVPPKIPINRIRLGDGSQRFSSLCKGWQPDLVFHLAAFAAEGLSPFVRQHTIRNTWLATADVINACIEAGSVQRLVFASSMAVYGAQIPPFDETLKPAPIDPYGVGKAACERDLQIAGEQHGLRWTIIRPHNVYGANQNIWGDYRNVLGIWMRQALEGRPLRVYGDGSQQRAFSYVDDCLPCFWRAATDEATRGQIVNLGGTKPTSILCAANLVREITGAPGIVHTEPRHEVANAWSTWQKSIDLLGYDERTSLEDGLARMWDWARLAWHRYPKRREQPPLPYEIRKGLYSWWQAPPAADTTSPVTSPQSHGC